jgi:fucose 4-O-acetylase-like acetyltransferase
MNRENWVDYAKAVGIILVVYGHVARGVVNAGVEANESLHLLIDSVIYSFHMPLFFFLSGLFFYQSLARRGSVNFVFSKIDTIVYPYIVWSILQGLIEVYLSKYTNGNVTFQEVFALLWSPRAHFWFLYALFFVFLVCTVIYSIPSSRKLSLPVFAVAVALYLFPGILPDHVAVNYLIQYLVFFCFGIVVTQYSLTQYLSKPFVLAVSAAVFVAAQWYFHQYLGLNYANKGTLALGVALISIVFMVSLSCLLARSSSRVLQFLGASSMAIYLIHVLAGSGVRVVLQKFLHVDSLLVHLVAGCAFAILCPILAVWVIDKLRIPFVFSAPISSMIGGSSANRIGKGSK